MKSARYNPAPSRKRRASSIGNGRILKKPPSDFLASAKAYDAALARRDYVTVAALLAPGVVYLSPNVVGRHEGRAAVLAMLQDFFTRHPDAHWSSQDWRLEKDSVTRRYRLSVPSSERAEERAREGDERFSFTPSGLIAAIEVSG